MSGEIRTPIIGNLTADPELRNAGGSPVANFNVAVTPRKFDRNANEFRDGETTFIRCAAWRDLAENVAATLHKGMRVVVVGELSNRPYEKDGQTRTSLELDVEAVGPELRYTTARVERVQKRQGGDQRPQGGPSGSYGQQASPEQAWGQQGGQAGGYGGGQQSAFSGGYGGQPSGGNGYTR